MPRESLQREDTPTDDSMTSSTVPKAGESSAALPHSESPHTPKRKRRNLAIPLAVMLGIVGASIGYVAEKPTYECTVLLRVNPVLPKVLFDTSKSSMLPMYDSYVQTQVSLIKSRRVVDMALQQNYSKQYDDAYSYDQADEFANNLSASRIKGTELIQVAFTDETPVRAKVGAESIVNSYMQIYIQHESEEEMERLAALDKREKSLEDQIAALQERILSVGGDFGQLAPDRLYDAELERLLSLEASMKEARFEMDTTIPSDSAEEREALEKRLDFKMIVLQESYDDSRSKLIRWGNLLHEIEDLRTDLSQAQNRLAYIRARRDELNLELDSPGRITQLTSAELPTGISNRREKTMLGTWGGFGGAILGLVMGLYRRISRKAA